jgi:hypothetical protein
VAANSKIERRLYALESSAREGMGGGSCPECGGPPDGKPGPNDTYELLFVDPEEDSENEWCQTCGRPIHITLTWGDER